MPIPDGRREVADQCQAFAGCLENTADGICILDSRGVILYLNPVYERITGLKPDALVGRDMKDMVRWGVFDQAASLRALELGRPVSLPLKLNTGKSVLVCANPVLDESGAVSRVVCSIRDVGELYRLESELHSLAALKNLSEEELRGLQGSGSQGRLFCFSSEAMCRIVELSLRLGSVGATVLLQGESGVGKEVIADLLHNNSLRRERPFIKVNCAAIPEPLLESELFGYRRGAFTGASREGKVGLFEAADGGALLLDEIGELSPALQVKLLRVIQEKVVRRIGDTAGRSVDVRVIAATNRDLAAMVEQGTFRQDLYYRINVVPIFIPPLRERKEDVASLTHIFLETFNKRHAMEKKLHPAGRRLLLEYSWPGNVRELENIIERLVITVPGNVIQESDVAALFSPPAAGNASRVKRSEEQAPSTEQPPAREQPLPARGETLKELMDAYEATVLRHCLRELGTTRAVAEALGINQSSVVRKMQRLKLQAGGA